MKTRSQHKCKGDNYTPDAHTSQWAPPQAHPYEARQDNSEIGKLGIEKFGKLGIWESGKLGNWEIRKLGHWEIWGVGNWRLGN